MEWFAMLEAKNLKTGIWQTGVPFEGPYVGGSKL